LPNQNLFGKKLETRQYEEFSQLPPFWFEAAGLVLRETQLIVDLID
jgi:hypothetical protein